MAKTYTSTIDARCFKEHTCVCCGAVYTYELYRKVSGTAANAEKAQANAAKAAATAMEREVDPEPCPTCGLVQPDMIAQRRVKRFGPVFWIALIAFALIVILRVAFVLRADTAVWVATAACAVAAVMLLRIDLADPNKDPETNRADATQRVAAGKLMLKPGKVVAGAQAMTRFPRSIVHKLTLVLVLAAVVAAAAPELLRISKGWPLNAETYPPVVGPGDQVRVYMNQKITSIKSYWKGDAQVTVTEPSTGKTHVVSAKTNDNHWQSPISYKSKEKNNTSTPWVEIPIPDAPALAGKSVTCDVRLNVLYPAALSGSSNYTDASAKMDRKISMTLAPAANAGGQYNDWWWLGSVGAMGVLLVASRLLIGSAKGLARKANPTRCLVPAAPPAGAGVPPLPVAPVVQGAVPPPVPPGYR